MLTNLLLEDISPDVVLFGSIFVFVFIFIIVLSIAGGVQAAKRKDGSTSNSPFELRNAEDANKNRSARLEDLKKKYQQKTGLDLSHSSLKGSDTHSHFSTGMEAYEDISGSLGEVNDEGCPELAGIRLISNDEAYDPENGEIDYNLQNVGLTMILGEVLEKPRFKRGK